MWKLHNVLLASALGAGSLLGAAVPASAARVVVRTVRPAATYVTRYRSYPYRYGYGYGYPYGYGVGIGVGYGGGYVGGGYGYAPYPAAYGAPVYWAPRPYWRPYRRVYRRPVFVR